jgi:short-subunit dehydrogenase
MNQNTKQQILVIGANGGIGSSFFESASLLSEYQVTGWTSQDLDLNFPERIFSCDLSRYDVLVNCTGHNQGTYLGFLNNSWQNQLSQITVNYISNLFLFKQYANTRSNGKYVWVSSVVVDTAKPYQCVYASSKVASKVSLDLAAREAAHIKLLEVKVGLVKTNLRFRNFEGTKTVAEVDATYGDSHVLSPSTVASSMLDAIQKNKTEIFIS